MYTMRVQRTDLYGGVILFAVFFIVYVASGDYQHRILRTNKLDRQEEYRVLIKTSEKDPPDSPSGFSNEGIHRRKSRLTKSMVAHRHVTTTTREPTRQTRNGTTHKFIIQHSTKTRIDISDLYTLRKNHLTRACRDRQTPQVTTYNPDNIQGTLLVDNKHSILYCYIPKVSSSFWKRTLTVMKEGDRYKSPFEVTLDQTSLPYFRSLKSELNSTEMDSFLKSASSFLFVRDPYARLFSGYVNKIYCPNKYYWKTMGTKIAKATRSDPSQMSLKYGHDITFAEFIKFILKFTERGYKLDSHFASMSSKCDPCRMPYDFIGKLETFNRDANYLISTWRDKFSDFNISFSDFERESIIDTADVHIQLLFTAWDFIQESGYPFYYMAQRVWSDLQIRGYLSKTIPFPYHPSEAIYITRESLLKAIGDALNRPVNKSQVRRQREEALIQAYRTVSLTDMEKLRKFVSKDCQLFGYDDRPDKLFDRSRPVETDHVYLVGL